MQRRRGSLGLHSKRGPGELDIDHLVDGRDLLILGETHNNPHTLNYILTLLHSNRIGFVAMETPTNFGALNRWVADPSRPKARDRVVRIGREGSVMTAIAKKGIPVLGADPRQSLYAELLTNRVVEGLDRLTRSRSAEFGRVKERIVYAAVRQRDWATSDVLSVAIEASSLPGIYIPGVFHATRTSALTHSLKTRGFRINNVCLVGSSDLREPEEDRLFNALRDLGLEERPFYLELDSLGKVVSNFDGYACIPTGKMVDDAVSQMCSRFHIRRTFGQGVVDLVKPAKELLRQCSPSGARMLGTTTLDLHPFLPDLCLGEAIKAGDTFALLDAAQLLEMRGHLEEAVRFHRAAVAAGVPGAAEMAVGLMSPESPALPQFGGEKPSEHLRTLDLG